MKAVSSSWKIVKKFQFFRSYGVPSLAHFELTDSGSKEKTSNWGTESSQANSSDTGNHVETLQLRSSEVVEILENLGNEPLSAFSFFKKLKEYGFQHDVQCYLAIIKILCQKYRGFSRELDSLFVEIIYSNYDSCFELSELLEVMANEVRDGGSSSLTHAFGVLVKSFASRGLFEEAVCTLFDIKGHGVSPCLFSCNYLINRLTLHGKTDTALAVYKNMKNLGLTPNEYTFAILVKAYCKEGNLEKVWELFSEKEGMDPIDAYGYNAAITGLAQDRRMLKAEIVFLEMLKRGLEVNYYSLIYGYCSSGDIKKALTIYDEMEANGVKSDCNIVTSILHCLCTSGMHNEVVEKFSNIKEQTEFVDNVSYNVAIDSLCKMGQLDEAVRLFDDMKSRNLLPDVVHYTTLIGGCFLSGKILYAQQLFEEMKLTGLEVDAIAYDVLAGGLSRCGLLDEVFLIFDEMKSQGLAPRSLTHKKIIEGLFSGGKLREAEKYFMKLYPKSIEHYTSMIIGYCNSGKATIGYAIFRKLFSQGILVSKCGLKLLSSLCIECEYDKAVKLFEMLLCSGCENSSIIYGKLVAALCRAGDMKRAQWVFDQMVSRGVSPDVPIYTMLMNGYFRTNCPQKALDLFTKMKIRGISPDAVAYTVLLDGLYKIISKVGKWNGLEGGKNLIPVVSELWKEMKKMKLKPDIILFTVLIDSYCKSGNIPDAVSVFSEMVEWGMIPDTVAYTALMSGYCSKGDLGRAYALLNEMHSSGVQLDKRCVLTLQHGITMTQKI